MDKGRLKNLVLYHIYSSKMLIGILLLIMIANLALGIVFKNSETGVGSIDMASYIFAMFVGYELFKEAFAFSIINGISRKTYYLSNIFSTIFISIFLGVTTGIFALISMEYGNNNILFYLMYKGNPLSLLLWCTVVIYAMICFFHFVSLVMYRVSKKTRYILILVLALIAPLTILANTIIDGLINSIQNFFLLFLGITGSGANITANSYLSSIMLLIFTIVIIAVSWLFLRKIEAK